MATIIVNGDGIKISFPDKEDIVLKKDKELNKKIIEIYQLYSLYNYPLVITGNVCISRGISIMSKDFIFDFGILSHITSKEEASQLAGRLKGNIKSLQGYKKPIVYTTKQFDLAASEMELKSRKLVLKLLLQKVCLFEPIISNREFNNISETHTIPIIIHNISRDQFNLLLTKKSNKYNEDYIKNFIEDIKGDTIFDGFEKDQISAPNIDKGTSYQKNIIELTKASNEQFSYSIAIKAANKKKKCVSNLVRFKK